MRVGQRPRARFRRKRSPGCIWVLSVLLGRFWQYFNDARPSAGIRARKGGGHTAGAMKTRPTDLTVLSRNNSRRFPDEKVMKILRGDQGVVAHGTKDMPVWGNVFNNMTSDLQLVQTRLHALREYLESIQQK